jgi:hypothetical protein
MLALAVVICECGPAGTWEDRPAHLGEHVPDHGELLVPAQPSPWQAEARFMIANADELLELLELAGVAGRAHPPHLSTMVSADLLFEDGDIIGETWLTRPDLTLLRPHATPVLGERISAWDAFSRVFEAAGHATRLIVWFIR